MVYLLFLFFSVFSSRFAYWTCLVMIFAQVLAANLSHMFIGGAGRPKKKRIEMK